MEAEENHVPRINQLDAGSLDQEIFKIFRTGLQTAFRYFLRNPLDSVGPELETFIRLFIWNFSLRARNASLGQQLLGIQFLVKNRFQIIGAGILRIAAKYIEARQTSIIRLFPAQEALLEKSFTLLQTAVKAAELVNFLVFLQKGIYPGLVERLYQLRPRSVVLDSRSVGYSYMSRELLWHSLTELLIFLLPLVDLSKFTTKFRTPAVGLNKCAVCLGAPVCRVLTPCHHVYCYYCVMSSLGDKDQGTCIVCRRSIHRQELYSTVQHF